MNYINKQYRYMKIIFFYIFLFIISNFIYIFNNVINKTLNLKNKIKIKNHYSTKFSNFNNFLPIIYSTKLCTLLKNDFIKSF